MLFYLFLYFQNVQINKLTTSAPFFPSDKGIFKIYGGNETYICNVTQHKSTKMNQSDVLKQLHDNLHNNLSAIQVGGQDFRVYHFNYSYLLTENDDKSIIFKSRELQAVDDYFVDKLETKDISNNLIKSVEIDYVCDHTLSTPRVIKIEFIQHDFLRISFSTRYACIEDNYDLVNCFYDN